MMKVQIIYTFSQAVGDQGTHKIIDEVSCLIVEPSEAELVWWAMGRYRVYMEWLVKISIVTIDDCDPLIPDWLRDATVQHHFGAAS